jgi:hypothetical protein
MVRPVVAEPGPGDMLGTTQAFSSVFRYPPIAFRRVGRPAGGFHAEVAPVCPYTCDINASMHVAQRKTFILLVAPVS